MLKLKWRIRNTSKMGTKEIFNHLFIPCLIRCILFLSTMLLCGGGGEGGKYSSSESINELPASPEFPPGPLEPA